MNLKTIVEWRNRTKDNLGSIRPCDKDEWKMIDWLIAKAKKYDETKVYLDMMNEKFGDML